MSGGEKHLLGNTTCHCTWSPAASFPNKIPPGPIFTHTQPFSLFARLPGLAILARIQVNNNSIKTHTQSLFSPSILKILTAHLIPFSTFLRTHTHTYKVYPRWRKWPLFINLSEQRSHIPINIPFCTEIHRTSDDDASYIQKAYSSTHTAFTVSL